MSRFTTFAFFKFITKNPLACVVVMIIEILGSIGIILTYGVIRNVFSSQEKETYMSTEFTYERSSEDTGSQVWNDAEHMKESFRQLSEEFEEQIAGFGIQGRIAMGDNDYSVCYYHAVSDEFYMTDIQDTYEQYVSGKNVVVVRQTDLACKVGDVIDISGKEYEVIATRSDKLATVAFHIPYMAAPNGADLKTIYVSLKKTPTKQQSKAIANRLKELFPSDSDVQEPVIPDLLVTQFNNTMLFACIAIIILIVSNCIAVYMYIIRRNIKMIYIFKLCGCKNQKLMSLFMIEILTLSCVCYLIGSVISKQLIISNMSNYYPLFKDVYTAKSYLYLFAGYVGVTFLFSLARLSSFLNKTTAFMRKEAAG